MFSFRQYDQIKIKNVRSEFIFRQQYFSVCGIAISDFHSSDPGCYHRNDPHRDGSQGREINRPDPGIL